MSNPQPKDSDRPQAQNKLPASVALDQITQALDAARVLMEAHGKLDAKALRLCEGMEVPGQIEPPANLAPTVGHVSGGERERLHGHLGTAIWITGLSASGKSTLAYQLELILHRRGCSTYVLDGDNLRMGLCADLGFSCSDRQENLRRVGEVMRLFVEAGVIVLCSFISPRQADRDWLRSRLGLRSFVEIYLRCPIEVCMQRDPKGLYSKALRGEISDFTGISAPYEEPHCPEMIIDSDRTPVTRAAASVVRHLEAAGLLPVISPMPSNPRLC